jgi:hypothetical protein
VKEIWLKNKRRNKNEVEIFSKGFQNLKQNLDLYIESRLPKNPPHFPQNNGMKQALGYPSVIYIHYNYNLFIGKIGSEFIE